MIANWTDFLKGAEIISMSIMMHYNLVIHFYTTIYNLTYIYIYF